MANENGFHVNVMQLSDLMDHRGQDAIFNLNKHFGNVYGLCNALDTSSNDGLIGTRKNLEQRRAACGSNIFTLKKSKTFLRLIWEALKDVTLIILEVAAVISFALGFYNPPPSENEEDFGGELEDKSETEWIEGVAILMAVLIVAVVTAFNDYTKEKQFRDLQNCIEHEHKFSVIRRGEVIQIPVIDIVVGDICLVKYGNSLLIFTLRSIILFSGDMIPADGIIIHSNDLKVDESSLTGESDHVKKGQFTDPILLSGI